MTSMSIARVSGVPRLGPTGVRTSAVMPPSPANATNFSQSGTRGSGCASASMPALRSAAAMASTRGLTPPAGSPRMVRVLNVWAMTAGAVRVDRA
jgi:hypothetical protein